MVAQTHQIVLLVGMTWRLLPVVKVAALRAGTPGRRDGPRDDAVGKRWFVIPEPDVWLVGEGGAQATLGRLGALQGPEGW